MSVKNLVTLVYRFSAEIRNGRTHQDVLRHTQDEYQELLEEIEKVKAGAPEGADGVLGEAVDIMTCVIDFAHEVGFSVDAVTNEFVDFEGPRQPSDSEDAYAPYVGEIRAAISVLNKVVEHGRTESDTSCMVVGIALSALIDLARQQGATMEQIEAIALKKCEKWKLHYSNSIDRQR